MAIEISFPRGGRKPPPDAKPKDIEQDHDLFGRKRKKDNKSVQKGNIIQPNEEASDAVEVTYVESLTSKTVQDGMILIGCIREIKKVAMDISLPGRLYGKVLVNNISKPYTKLLQNVVDQNDTEGYKPLSELFTLGQCVAVKILSLNDEKLGITLTLMPQQINANLSHSSIKTGMVLWGAISEVEDHGYVVDLGINNCRAFLKKENCDAKKEYVVGELLWFAVSKADISPTATTIMLSTKQNIIKNMKIRDEISLDHLISGMQVDFTITKILKNGLAGKFLKKFTGYIELGLSNNISNTKKFHVDKVIQARILYMVPVTKIAYLTIKTLDIHTRDKLENGALVHGKVLGISPIGVYLKLKDTAKRGFVPIKHAQRHKSQDKFIDFMYLKRNYRKNTAHDCRILSYDYFEQMYICSTEYGLTKEGIIYSLDDLNNGQAVSAEIKEIDPRGLLVNIQHVNGFIKNEHLCDTVLKNYNKIKSRLKVGQKVQVRVWVVNSSKKILYLTMRPSLVNTDLILKSYEEAKKGQQYLGVVRQITTNGLLVQFFGDVHGWVPKKELHFDATHRLDMLFKIGQLVKCTVVDRKKAKLTLSLQTSIEISEDTDIELKLGEHVTGIVTHITNEGIHVTVKDTDISAFIPTLYLSKFTKMAPILQKMYKTGDEIPDLVYVNYEAMPVLSLRNSDLQEDNIEDIKSLKRGTVLPCTVSTTDSLGVYVEAPILRYKKTILVPKESLSSDPNVTTSDLRLNQFIYAKVINISKNLDHIVASAKLSDVWNFDIQSSVQYFSEYINELLKIREYFKEQNNPVACLNLGEIVSGTVRQINEDKSCVLSLENGAKAIVPKEHIKEDISINDKVEGVVLFWNFANNEVEVALCPKLISRINHIQNANINIPAGVTNKSNAHAEVLLKKDDFTLGVLRGAAGKRQLIFFPTKLHPNDFKKSVSEYVIGDYINIQVNKIENGIIIGLLKQLVKDMNFKWKINLKQKHDLDDNIQEQPPKKRQKMDSISESDDKKINKNKEKYNIKGNANQINNSEEIVENGNTKQKKKKKSMSTDEGNEEPKIKREKKSSISEENMEGIKKSEKQRKKKNSISTDEDTETNITDEVSENINEQKRKKKKKKNSISTDEDTEANITDEVSENKNEQKKKRKKKTSISTDEDTETNINENIKIKKERKTSITDEVFVNKNEQKKKKKNSISLDEESPIENKKEKKKRKLSEESIEPQPKSKQNVKKSKQEQSPQDVPVLLPGADNFWNIPENVDNNEEESSEDDEPSEKELEKLRKKKKLTPAERAEAARLEEERIRKIELELADAETAPKTPDQFDRLVLANPNNSMLWINYMAFHLEATEIEKARAIARKALNTIEFREEQEKLNVWLALLNLENRYGTKESFASVLEEAVKMNDSLSVYLQSLTILSDSGKITEFLELLKTVSKKFKQDFKMWTSAAEACYKCDLKEEARNLMQRSLKSLDEKQHINILVQFAFMESRHNEPERAEALLEKVLASYPRRVDVWTSYVDMLIKGKRIHIARNVLERAIGQKLPARKMKTLFSKYIQFETKYGDEESVKKVRLLATEYVKTALN